MVDWGISRNRYWGCPMPLWTCECGHQECIGSIAELKEKGINVPEDIELHKPYIDDVHLKCPECGKQKSKMSRSLTKQQFINKAKKILGENYDFRQVFYTNNKAPVVIICKKHGPFCLF